MVGKLAKEMNDVLINFCFTLIVPCGGMNEWVVVSLEKAQQKEKGTGKERGKIHMQGIKIGEIKNVPLTISFFIYTSLLKGLVDRKKKKL